MLDQNIKTQLKAYLERLESPIELVAALDDSDKAAKIKELVTEIAELLIKSRPVLMVKIHAVQVLVLLKSVNNHVCSLLAYRWVMSLLH
jgi:alkyl hydroperoxide reductase subunit F